MSADENPDEDVTDPGCIDAVRSEREKSPTCHFQNQQIRNERLQNLRKAKSRNAARTRRGNENYEFYELAKLLPVPHETSSQLDKASIIRLTMSYLRVREFTLNGSPPWNTSIEGPPPNRTVKDMSGSHQERSGSGFSTLAQSYSRCFEQYLGSHMLQSLDGFMFALNCHGKFIYVSENISMCLGLSQVDMIGSSIFDYTYPADQDEMAVQLGLTLSSCTKSDMKYVCSQHSSDCSSASLRSFNVRMKSTLTRRGLNMKSSCYKVVHMCTRSRLPNVKNRKVMPNIDLKYGKNGTNGLKTLRDAPLGIFGMGKALPSQLLNDISLNRPVFVTRLNPAFKFTYCETSIESLLGYNVREVVGRSFYQNIHVDDIEKLKKCHSEILHRGQLESPYYRWLHKSGGYVWIHSCVTVLANQRLYPEESFIWINHTISEHVEEGNVLDISQSPGEILKGRSSSCSLISGNGDPDKNGMAASTTMNEVVQGAIADDLLCERSSAEPASILSVSGNNFSESVQRLETNTPSSACVLGIVSPQEYGDKHMPAFIHNAERPPTTETDTIDLPPALNSDVCEKRAAKSPISDEKCTSTKRTTGARDEVALAVELLPHKRKRTTDQARVPDCEKARVIKHEGSHSSHCDNALTVKENSLVSSKLAHATNGTGSDAAAQTKMTQSISDYLDTDSLVWLNPPNKEISNHNDLPPGIKLMHGMCAVRHTPSAVHHHYPFGMNPSLLHSNPFLAKIMMAGWDRCRQHFQSSGPCLVANPVPLISPHVPLYGCSQKLRSVTQTPASVAAVLEELKKDPLHKINPPNKVVIPNLLGSCDIPGIEGAVLSYGPLSDHTVYANACEARSGQSTDGEKSSTEIPRSASLAAESVALLAGNLVTQHMREQTLLQVPNSLIVSPNTVLMHSSDSPFVAIGPDSVIKLPFSSTSLRKQFNPCVLQTFSFPQVAEIPSVHL